LSNAQDIADLKLPRWTQAEDALLRAQWAIATSMLAISRMLPGRSRGAVAGRISRLHLKLSKLERLRRISTGSAIGRGAAS
jgi:hypothetical protein